MQAQSNLCTTTTPDGLCGQMVSIQRWSLTMVLMYFKINAVNARLNCVSCIKPLRCLKLIFRYLMNWFSVLTMVWRNLRYCTCLPCDSMLWTKCWTTFSFTSLHNVSLPCFQFYKHFTSIFSANILAPKNYKDVLLLEKSCAKHFQTKKVYVKC